MNTNSETPLHPNDVDKVKSSGQKLLNCIRRLETLSNLASREDTKNGTAEQLDGLETSSTSTLVQDVLDTLQTLIQSVSRYGLFPRDEASAKLILESSSFGNSPNRGSGRKRGRQNKQDKKGGLVVYSEDSKGADKKSDSSSRDANLLITAVLRVLGSQQQQTPFIAHHPRNPQGLSYHDRCLILLLSADLCTAVTESALSSHDAVSALAERELLLDHGKPLLAGFCKSLQSISDSSLLIAKPGFQIPVFLADEILQTTVRSCFRASASILRVCGPKLGRSTQVVSLRDSLTSLGWKFYAVTLDSSTQEALSVFHVNLLYSFGSNELWSATVAWQEVIDFLGLFIQTTMPVSKKLDAWSESSKSSFSPATKNAFDDWLGAVQGAQTESERESIIVHVLEMLGHRLMSLLSPDALIGGTKEVTASELDLLSFLNLIEALVGFPLSAENTYFGTRKRLRHEAIEGGYVNPLTICNMANRIKLMGHQILERSLLALSDSVFQPLARRLLRTSYAALLTACSETLRNVLEGRDGKLGNDGTGGAIRWLRTSISVRNAAMRSLQQSIAAVGIDPCKFESQMFGLARGQNMTGAGVEMSRMVNLVCGCLIEQLDWLDAISNEQDNHDQTWGTLAERVTFVISSAGCLGTCLISGGAFLPPGARGLIDSLADTFLLHCRSGFLRLSHYLSDECYVAMNNAALEFGTQCLLTPWPDGAACGLRGALRKTAQQIVSFGACRMTAQATLAFCDTLATPRVPALNFVVRRTQEGGTSNGLFSTWSNADSLGGTLRTTASNLTQQEQERKSLAEQKRSAKRSKHKEGSKAKSSPTKRPKLDESPQKLQQNAQSSEEKKATTEQSEACAKTDAPEKDIVESQSLSLEKVNNGSEGGASHPGAEESNTNEASVSMTSTGNEKGATPVEKPDPSDNDDEDDDGEDIPMIFDAPPDEEDQD